MSVKFVSKNSNYMLVIRPGVPGSPITGQQPITGVYVHFKDGFSEIKDDTIAEKMRHMEGYGRDFIEVKDDELHPEKDPYAAERSEVEPVHVMGEMKYGRVEGRAMSKRTKLPAALQKTIEAEAIKLAKAMLPGMLKETLKALVEEQKAEQKKAKAPKVEVEESEEVHTDKSE